MICAPIVIDGFSAVIGSWKIIEISLPRMRDSAASVAERRSTAVELRRAALDLARRASGQARGATGR